MMMGRFLHMMILAAFVAVPATAEPYRCDFTAECVSGQDCTESAYGIEISTLDHEGQLYISSVIGTTTTQQISLEGQLPRVYASLAEGGPTEMISINADNTALMTTHFTAPGSFAVTYFGTCEDL
jgi:hypothetical protein